MGRAAQPPAGTSNQECPFPLPSLLGADRFPARPQPRQEHGAAPLRWQLGAGAPQPDHLGPHRRRKSFLSSAIGHQACLQGFKTRYWNYTKFFPQCKLWVAAGSYLKELEKIAKTDVVIFDDFGLQHLDGPARLTLLELLEDRVGRRSTVKASQLPVDQ